MTMQDFKPMLGLWNTFTITSGRFIGYVSKYKSEWSVSVSMDGVDIYSSDSETIKPISKKDAMVVCIQKIKEYQKNLEESLTCDGNLKYVE